MDQKSLGSTVPEGTPKRTRWDTTPMAKHDLNNDPKRLADRTPNRVQQTPSRFSQTPVRKGEAQTPRRWDDKTPMIGGATPGYAGATPTPNNLKTPDILNLPGSKLQQLRWEKQLQERNRPYTDEELDMLLPGNDDGYEILKAPENYQPQSKNGLAPASESYKYPNESPLTNQSLQISSGDLPPIKTDQYKFFAPLLEKVDENDLSLEQQKTRKILTMLLKIKDGNPQMRKSALRQITINAREFGAGPLFNHLLPLFMATNQPQQRHLLVKVVDRILYKLDDLVRPYTHKILIVILPMLVDQDYYARVQGREIISNLAKAAGLPTMITTMRPDIDHKDQYVRNTISRAFAVVGSALGIGALLPFLKAVCMSKKSWEARYTGIKTVQQIAILMGCSILPYLKQLVQCIKNGLDDAQKKVKSLTALALSALAQASAPYGIQAFNCVLQPLWKRITQVRDKSLGAFLKAVGFIFPLMESRHAAQYIKTIMPTLIRQFQTPDDELRKIVLKVLKQVLVCDGVDAQYIRKDVLEPFFRCFWVRRMASDKRNYKQLVQTTVEIAIKVGVIQIIEKLYLGLKDENEPFRKMVMEGITKILQSPNGSEIGYAPENLRNELMDCVLAAFHEQNKQDKEESIILNGFGAVVNALGLRAKPYFVQIVGTIHWRLNHKSTRIRQQAADLIVKIAHSMKICGQQARLGRLGLNLNECLRQEYPEVLGSILGALKSIVIEIGMAKMTPPIKDLLPRLTPILKNRNDKVQENCIQLVGRIADKGADEVSPKQWIRICFDLLQMLKAHRKNIRRATVVTFGFIARAIGPQDVLVTLLNNLKVQERQLRICTTVAIAIVSQSCGPFTVLPALMNQYRIQELNVQNGVLKSLAFMFEYIGEMAKDYIYAVTPLLQDALTDRDLVHRQTAAASIKHLALGVQGFGCEDALIHLLNYIWPNVFQTSPHVINSVLEAVEGIRCSVGGSIILMYTLQGLWHPARRVRHTYWRIYNMIYVSTQDSLVPFQPVLKDDEYNHYGQPQLMMSL